MPRKKPPQADKRTTARKVQATQNDPAPTQPPPKVKPDEDDGAWGDDGLTVKQRRFCEAYVGEAAGNAVKAAGIAGYRDDNYFALAATGSENLKKPQIRSYVGRLLAQIGMTPAYLKSRVAQRAQASMDNFLTLGPTGEVEVDLKQAAALGALGQLKELKEETVESDGKILTRKRTIKVHDPLPAQVKLLEMLGVLKGDAPEVDRVFLLRPVRTGGGRAGDPDRN